MTQFTTPRLVILRLEKGTSIRDTICNTKGCYLFFAFSMCFRRCCYSIYKPIDNINHRKQPYGLLRQAYHILDIGNRTLGYSMGSLSPLLFCKFLNNCETNCRHTAASSKNKKTEFAVNLVVKN